MCDEEDAGAPKTRRHKARKAMVLNASNMARDSGLVQRGSLNLASTVRLYASDL